MYDVARILAADPDAKTKPGSPLWGGYGVSHYWGEPLFGYYRSDDPWVLRRHPQLLADAGVDVLGFDTTNAVIYRDIYRKLCDVFAAVRREGGRTPQICFMVNTEAGKTAQQIYDDLYKPGLYPELWFRWQGKPLMICDPQAATPEVSGFFTLRRAHWPFEMINTPNAWHLGGHLPAAVRLHGRPEEAGAGQRLRLPKPAGQRRQGHRHEQRRRARTELPRRQDGPDNELGERGIQLSGAVETRVRAGSAVRDGDLAESSGLPGVGTATDR